MRINDRRQGVSKESPFYHYSDQHIENLKNNYIPKRLDDLLEIESGFKNNKKADFGKEDINECVVKAIEYLKKPSKLTTTPKLEDARKTVKVYVAARKK